MGRRLSEGGSARAGSRGASEAWDLPGGPEPRLARAERSACQVTRGPRSITPGIQGDLHESIRLACPQAEGLQSENRVTDGIPLSLRGCGVRGRRLN